MPRAIRMSEIVRDLYDIGGGADKSNEDTISTSRQGYEKVMIRTQRINSAATMALKWKFLRGCEAAIASDDRSVTLSVGGMRRMMNTDGVEYERPADDSIDAILAKGNNADGTLRGNYAAEAARTLYNVLKVKTDGIDLSQVDLSSEIEQTAEIDWRDAGFVGRILKVLAADILEPETVIGRYTENSGRDIIIRTILGSLGYRKPATMDSGRWAAITARWPKEQEAGA